MAVEADPGKSSGTPRLPRRFWTFWGANTISWLGDGTLLVGFPLLAASLTHSPLWVAAVAFVQRLPAWFLAIPIGAAVDRLDPRRTAILVNTAQALVLGGVAILIALGHFPLIALMAAAFITEGLATVFTCASGALLAETVAPELFGLANTRLRAAQSTARIVVGPGLGGLLFALGHQWPVVVDAATFVVAAGILTALHIAVRERKTGAVGERRFLQEIKDGLRFCFGEPAIRLIAATLGTLAGFQAGSVAIFVLFGTEDLKLSKTAFGLTLAIGNVAAPVMVLLLPRVAALRPSRAIAGAIAAACVGEVLLGTATTPVQAAIGLALDSSAVTVGSVSMLTARMRLVPREMLGRMTGAFQTITYGSIALGTLLGGAVAHINLRGPYLLCGAACLVLLIVAGPRLQILDPVSSPASSTSTATASPEVKPLGKPAPADRS